jgi:hypothetical protein
LAIKYRAMQFAAVALGLGCTAVQADVLISDKPTRHISCEAGMCTANNSNANLNVSELATMLSSGDVTVTTGGYFVNIEFRNALSWTSARKLTLSANGIVVKSPITVAGQGGVNVQTDDRNLDLAFLRKGRMIFWDLGSNLIINGDKYTLVSNIAGLQSAIAENPSGHFALASNYDASSDGTYAASPIPQQFTGIFDGLGNTISHFTLVSSAPKQNTGLFAWAAGKLYDLGLPQADVTGGDGSYANIGAVAGIGSGDRVWATGTVKGGASAAVGGLYGSGGGTENHFRGKVTGGDNSMVGGIAGLGGGISSWSDGTVRGGNDSLVGDWLAKAAPPIHTHRQPS